MTTYRFVLFALTALFTTTLGSWAQTNFTADLTPDQETAGPLFTMSGGGARPMSFGTAMFVLSADMSQLTMTVTITNIDVNGSQTPADANDNLGNAHIHGGAGPGANAGVVWGFFGSPDNDDNPDQFMLTPFATGVGGTFTSIWDMNEGNGTTLKDQLSNLTNGLCYINFHTAQNPGGEIRGQIVPEPSTTILLVAGIAGAAAGWRKRRR